MSKESKKLAKKKSREAKVKVKLQKRRDQITKSTQESKKQYLLQKLIKKLEKENPDGAKLAQIRRNLEVLKALEQEYIDEQKSRSDLNEELSKEGFSSLEEKIKKMREIAQKTVDSAKDQLPDPNNLGTFSGSAVCSFEPKK